MAEERIGYLKITSPSADPHEAKFTIGDKELEKIRHVQVNFSVDDLVTAELEIFPEHVEIENATIKVLALIDPITGETKRVKKIIFEDDTDWEQYAGR
jgi:hypothetical protein